MTTPYDALRAALAADPARPLVTYVGPEGRTELSVRTYENNVAKAAGLLRDGLDVQPGDPVALLVPAHWQAAVWLGACWAAGAVACFDTVDGAEVALAESSRLPEAGGADTVLRVGRHPFGLPATDPLPPGASEAAVEVRAYSDVFTPYSPPEGADPALRVGGEELTAAEVMAAAADLAARCGLETGGRLLAPGETVGLDLALALVAVPLAVDAAVVLVPHTDDAEQVARTEHITARLS